MRWVAAALCACYPQRCGCSCYCCCCCSPDMGKELDLRQDYAQNGEQVEVPPPTMSRRTSFSFAVQGEEWKDDNGRSGLLRDATRETGCPR